ncbi:RNA polymerase sigma-70 factor [Pedobacter sp. KBS0701]|uniref:RNA polymerase sigma-70 factor n=1 Tax=Pedobacter sp. KBS0701 TaxID=2578106 RepID=UPI00110F3217|nr:RNA polymerase sigma-70 factor [Pedobacter sp. KBS0701]QDW27913.1 RNA polymerase sigma-70 factor [Pedobacter sp. KBS0701]
MIAYHLLSDSELAAQLKTGDDVAFNEIYKRYWKSLYESAYAVLKDSTSCDDIVQEIFVWVWTNREKHLTDSFRPYLHAAVKYKIANLIRHGKVKDAYLARSLTLKHRAETDENELELKELKEIIAQFTSKLPSRAKLIFQLSRNELLSNKEIALQLGISEKTVENQMNISLKKLKKTLGNLSFLMSLI